MNESLFDEPACEEMDAQEFGHEMGDDTSIDKLDAENFGDKFSDADAHSVYIEREEIDWDSVDFDND